MKKHPNEITITNGTPEELAIAIRKTRYDYQEKLYKELMDGYKEDFIHDKKIKHPQLALLLSLVPSLFYPIVKIFHKIWKKCAPYMEKN